LRGMRNEGSTVGVVGVGGQMDWGGVQTDA
jgi:hypothetical protein